MAYNGIDDEQDEQIVPYVQDDDHAQLLSMLGLAPQAPPPEPDQAQPASDDQIVPITSDTSDKQNSDDDQATAKDSSITPTIASPNQNTQSAAPVTTPFDSRLQADQAKIDALRSNGSGVSNRHGFLGGLLKAGDIAGSILAPHAMALIPGTTLNYRQNLAGAQGQLNQDTENQSKQIQMADQQAQIAQRQDGLNALKPVGTPIETAQGTYQTFTDKHGNPVTKKLDIPAGKAGDYELKESVDPTTGKSVYAVVNKTNPNDVRYTDAQVAPKDNGPIDSSDKALAVVNKAHQAYTDAVTSGDVDKIQKAKDTLTVATQNYQNFLNSTKDKSAAEAAGRAPEQAANRAAGVQTEMQKTGAALATKADADINDVVSKANNVKASIQAAKNGNELAASIAPLQTTLFITTSEGVKRINETELGQVSGAGTLVQEVNGWLSKKVSGDPVPDKIKNDMVSLMDIYSKSAGDKYQRTLNSINQRHGTNFQPQSDYAQQPAAQPQSQAGTIRVQIPGQPPGTISATNQAKFLADHPNATVLQ
jgi:hypothetical protein